MIKIVFFATPDIAIKSLDYLNQSDDFEVAAVVCQPDKPTGRGHKITCPPIKNYAIEHNIEVLQPSCIRKDDEVMNRLREIKPDFFVTFAFGQILSQEVLDIPKFDTINLHASLLPKYRGANPIQCAIINGDKETGICTMITEAGLDCGDICLCEKIDINCEMNFEQLHDIIADDSPELISKTLKQLYEGKLVSIPQKHDEATVAPKIKKEDTKINWSKSAGQIHNLIRGIYKAPCAHFTFNNKIIKVLQSQVVEAQSVTPERSIGSVIAVDKKGIQVSCGKGFLNIIKVRPEGKGEMLARDWANGARIKVGDIFE
jgi:methionyl-tRNA formyltransferase